MAKQTGRKKDSRPDSGSFEGATKKAQEVLWLWIPPRLRLPIAFLIFIGSTLLASQSLWYPWLKGFFREPYEELFPKVDACADAHFGSNTLFVFDLDASNVDAARLNAFMTELTHKLSRGTGGHLESYGLLGGETLSIKRCPEVSVRVAEVARALGVHLKGPGVIWGYLEEKPEEFKSITRFTGLIDEGITASSEISYSNNIFELLQADRPVDNKYLAFASFILGCIHMDKGRTALARQCFEHTMELDALPELHSRVEQIILSLESANVANGLEPLTGRNP